jgi:ubiquinone biosynthesis protein UbiJ
VTLVAERTERYARERLGMNGDSKVAANLRTILTQLEQSPKSRKWRLRARVGERVRWYELPEEVEH